MMKISNSAILILTSAIFSFTNSTFAIVSFSLGVAGAIISYTVRTSENHQKAKEVEQATESITSIISGLATGSRDKSNLH